MPSDASEVDAALSAKLLGDAQLMAAMPDGVFFDMTTHGETKFVIIKLMDHNDAYMYQGSAYERSVYLVKAVALSSTGADVKAAAARIHTLLQDGALSPVGYSLMVVQRIDRVRYTEEGPDADARWQHRGGNYEVLVSPN